MSNPSPDFDLENKMGLIRRTVGSLRHEQSELTRLLRKIERTYPGLFVKKLAEMTDAEQTRFAEALCNFYTNQQ